MPGKYPKSSATILLDDFELEKRTWAVAGGKGGTGKTVITCNLGVGLAILGYKVILIDGDLGGADLHLSFGMPVPKTNLNDFLSGRVSSLNDVLLPTPSANPPRDMTLRVTPALNIGRNAAITEIGMLMAMITVDGRSRRKK